MNATTQSPDQVQTAHLLSEDDVQDFNAALSLVLLGAPIEEPAGVDEAVHLRNLCRVAAEKLCGIRDRLSPNGIELEGGC